MRSWWIIPAMGAASATAALVLGIDAPGLAAVAMSGAAIAAAIRGLAGESAAALTGAVIAPLLMIASLFDPGLGEARDLTRAGLAIAAAAWTVAELARPSASRLVALLPATVAAVLDPSFAGLVAVAAARLFRQPAAGAAGAVAPWRDQRWAIAAAGFGGAAVVLAVIAGAADTGMFGALGVRWYGGSGSPMVPGALAMLAGDVVGPVTAVAALAGLAVIARRRPAELAIAASIAGAILVDLRAGSIGPSTIAVAALSAGLAVGRLAGLIRLASGQAIIGAACGMLLVVPPAWTAIERDPRVAIEHASR